MTKLEAVKVLGIDENRIDYALPQQFFDEIINHIDNPLGNFVWSYEVNTVFGLPRPITEAGIKALQSYNQAKGYEYPVNYMVIEDL